MKEIEQENIDRYILDKMTAEERKTFEKKMSANKELQSQVIEQKKTILHIKGYSADKKAWIRDIVKDTNVDDETSPKNARRVFLRIAAVAASIALLIGIFFIITNNHKADPIALFENYYEAFSEVTLSPNSSDQQLKQIADKAYLEKRYEEALNAFKQINPLNSKQQIMLGICYLETGDYSSAIQQFEKNYSNINYKNDAKWYAALSYLKQDKIKESKNLLQQIQSGKYNTTAQELLQQLK